MRRLANLIVKTNEWYEGLPNLTGEMFYLGLVFIPYIIIVFGTAILYPSKYGILNCGLGLLWILLVILWRVSFKSIIEYRKTKSKWK